MWKWYCTRGVITRLFDADVSEWLFEASNTKHNVCTWLNEPHIVEKLVVFCGAWKLNAWMKYVWTPFHSGSTETKPNCCCCFWLPLLLVAIAAAAVVVVAIIAALVFPLVNCMTLFLWIKWARVYGSAFVYYDFSFLCVVGSFCYFYMPEPSKRKRLVLQYLKRFYAHRCI